MATFELERPPLVEAMRGWRTARSLPLYAGGLLGGLAIGFGIAAATSGTAELPVALPVELPAVTTQFEIGIPSTVAPAAIEPVSRLAEEGLFPWPDPVPGGVLFPTYPVYAPVAVAEPEAPVAPSTPAEQPAAAPVAPAAALPQVPEAQPVPPATVDPAPVAPPVKPNFYVPQASTGALIGLEQRFFDAANKERVAAGLAPLTFDSTLTVIARTRSQQLVDQGYFGHTDPYGYSMYVELLAHFGINWYAWAGENLAMNNYAEAESPERAMVALMNSPTHKRNILATEFSRLGVGLVTHSDGRKFYTMIFLS